MTLELNIFHLNKKHMNSVEEGQEEVCLIETILEEHVEQQQQQHDVLIEELSDLFEELQETQDMCAIHVPWRKKGRNPTSAFLETMSLKILTLSLYLWN